MWFGRALVGSRGKSGTWFVAGEGCGESAYVVRQQTRRPPVRDTKVGASPDVGVV